MTKIRDKKIKSFHQVNMFHKYFDFQILHHFKTNLCCYFIDFCIQNCFYDIVQDF